MLEDDQAAAANEDADVTRFSPQAIARRRRLLISLLEQSSNEAPVAQDPAPAEPATTPVVSPATTVPSQPARPPAADRRPPCTVPGFLRLLQTAPKLTWVFSGDSLTLAGPQPIRGGTYASFLVRLMRDRIGRNRDAFVATAGPEVRLVDVMKDYANRVRRFEPDILVLNCGYQELIRTDESLLAFERMFHQLIRRAHSHGAMTIVNTPPCNSFRKSSLAAELLVRLEAIRACTLESSALLVDHWAHWEESATPEWYRPDGVHPSERGALEMAQLFVRELHLSQLLKGSRTTARKNPQAPRQAVPATDAAAADATG